METRPIPRIDRLLLSNAPEDIFWDKMLDDAKPTPNTFPKISFRVSTDEDVDPFEDMIPWIIFLDKMSEYPDVVEPTKELLRLIADTLLLAWEIAEIKDIFLF